MNLCGIALKNPVLAASGTYGYGIEFESVADLNALGGLVTKGLSREPMDGNRPPRIWETEAGMMNSIGLQNIGVAALRRDLAPVYATWKVPVIASIMGFTVGEYAEVARRLEGADGFAGIDAEINASQDFDISGAAGEGEGDVFQENGRLGAHTGLSGAHSTLPAAFG